MSTGHPLTLILHRSQLEWDFCHRSIRYLFRNCCEIEEVCFCLSPSTVESYGRSVKFSNLKVYKKMQKEKAPSHKWFSFKKCICNMFSVYQIIGFISKSRKVTFRKFSMETFLFLTISKKITKCHQILK